MFDYLRNYSSNFQHVCCKDSPTKDLCDHCQSDDLYLHSRSQVRLRVNTKTSLALVGLDWAALAAAVRLLELPAWD